MKTTCIGRCPSMEDDLQWKTTSNGRGTPMEDKTSNGKRPPMEDNIHWKTTTTYQKLNILAPRFWIILKP
jgi:hypothetical protein